MEIALSEEQSLLRSSLRETLSHEVTFTRVRELERAGGSDTRLWSKLAELGWLSLPFPEEVGGSGGSLVDLAIATEEVARTAAIVPFAEAIAAGLAVSRFGGSSFSPLVTEVQQGSEIVLPAVLDENDSYIEIGGNGKSGELSAKRRFVDYAADATAFLVRTAEGLALASDPSRFHLTPLTGIARTPVADVSFDGAAVSAVCGNEGWQFLRRLMRALTAVQCLAYAQVAAEMATEYVKNRVQFGRPLGSFQAVQHHCANMAILNHGCRFLAYEAVWALDQGEATDKQIDMAKAWAARSAVEVTALSHQLHGGIGVTEEYDLHFFSRRAKDRAVAWGTPEECLDNVAKSIDEPVDWS